MSSDENNGADSILRVVGGRYEAGAVLGVGSSAVVRRARDLHTGEYVALKHFHPGGSAHDERQQRLETEALTRLDHPGLIGLRDAGSEEQRRFVVTDLVEGPTLAERIQAGPPVQPGAVRRIGAELAEALAHVHEAGFVHRDVKPANVLLDEGTHPRLADFGIARAVDSTAATATGCVVGTAAYLAPEQARGECVGSAADVYSLGLVLLEMLTGRREYPGLAVESATARLHRPPVVPDGLPSGFGPLLRSMTADQPAERPTAAEVAGILAAGPVVDTSPDVETVPVVGMRRGRHHHRGSRALLPVVAVLLAVLTIAGGVVVFTGVGRAPVSASSDAPPPVAPTVPAGR